MKPYKSASTFCVILHENINQPSKSLNILLVNSSSAQDKSWECALTLSLAQNFIHINFTCSKLHVYWFSVRRHLHCVQCGVTTINALLKTGLTRSIHFFFPSRNYFKKMLCIHCVHNLILLQCTDGSPGLNWDIAESIILFHFICPSFQWFYGRA